MPGLNRFEIAGQYWTIRDEYSQMALVHNARNFRGDIDLSENKFAGIVFDPFGHATIMNGVLTESELTFTKIYSTEAQKNGGSTKPIHYQFKKVELGGWVGTWSIEPHNDPNDKGKAVITVFKPEREPIDVRKYLGSGFGCNDRAPLSPDNCSDYER